MGGGRDGGEEEGGGGGGEGGRKREKVGWEQERRREVRLKIIGKKNLHISAYLLPLLVGCSELTQGGGKLSNQIMATVCIPVIATDLHTQVN